MDITLLRAHELSSLIIFHIEIEAIHTERGQPAALPLIGDI